MNNELKNMGLFFLLLSFFVCAMPLSGQGKPASQLLLGDVNFDATVDMVDAFIICKSIFEPSILIDPDLADVNEDGQINIIDALFLSRYSVRLIEFHPENYSKRVKITNAAPESLQLDSFYIDSATIQGDILTLSVESGGGCRRHIYNLYASNTFLESYPVQINVFLKHDAQDDPCKAIITDTVTFNMSPIALLYKQYYQDQGPIILNIYQYFYDVPMKSIQVTYPLNP